MNNLFQLRLQDSKVCEYICDVLWDTVPNDATIIYRFLVRLVLRLARAF